MQPATVVILVVQSDWQCNSRILRIGWEFPGARPLLERNRLEQEGMEKQPVSAQPLLSNGARGQKGATAVADGTAAVNRVAGDPAAAPQHFTTRGEFIRVPTAKLVPYTVVAPSKATTWCTCMRLSRQSRRAGHRAHRAPRAAHAAWAAGGRGSRRAPGSARARSGW